MFFADNHGGTDVCQLCGTVQSMYSTIVYEEDKRTFGEDKDGEKGADHRRTSAVINRDLSDLSKPLPGFRRATLSARPDLESNVEAPVAYSAPTVEAMGAVAAALRTQLEESSEEAESDGEGEGNTERMRWKLKVPVLQWGTTRQSQMREGFNVMVENGFISFDQSKEAQAEADCCLRAVVHDEHNWWSHHMASSAFWTCVFTMKNHNASPVSPIRASTRS